MRLRVVLQTTKSSCIGGKLINMTGVNTTWADIAWTVARQSSVSLGRLGHWSDNNIISVGQKHTHYSHYHNQGFGTNVNVSTIEILKK